MSNSRWFQFLTIFTIKLLIMKIISRLIKTKVNSYYLKLYSGPVQEIVYNLYRSWEQHYQQYHHHHHHHHYHPPPPPPPTCFPTVPGCILWPDLWHQDVCRGSGRRAALQPQNHSTSFNSVWWTEIKPQTFIQTTNYLCLISSLCSVIVLNCCSLSLSLQSLSVAAACLCIVSFYVLISSVSCVLYFKSLTREMECKLVTTWHFTYVLF